MSGRRVKMVCAESSSKIQYILVSSLGKLLQKMAKFCLLILIGGFLVSDTNSEYTYEAPQSVDGQTWNVVDDSKQQIMAN